MLYLNRKPGEAVIINQSIEVRVIEVRGRTVKLGFTFPPEATVLREEIVQSIEQANRAALAAVHALPGVDRPAAAGTASAFGSQSAVPLSSTEPPPGAPGHPIYQSAKTP